MFIQARTFFSLFPILQNKGFIDVNLHANSYTMVCLFIYLRTSFRAQKKNSMS